MPMMRNISAIEILILPILKEKTSNPVAAN